ncbi:MAG TPA: ScpA family protein [Acidimicrobiales bacterium]|nr:ScpA family protein [Acidimicrobiales bacterium]
MAYEVRTEIFEGPFDLLLQLITAEQVDLYEISLSKIVDSYLRELERMESLDLDIATEFLLIAATLVELKSRRLLPGLDDGEIDEELALWEERDLLLARLLECKTFKDAAAELARMAEVASRSHARTAGPDERFLAVMPDLLAGVTPAQLRQAFLRAMEPRPEPRVQLDHVAPIRASVQDAVDELVRELPRVGVTTFRRLTEGCGQRLEVIVRFLALLELYKRGSIDLEQRERLGELRVTWLGEDAALLEEIAVEEYQG